MGFFNLAFTKKKSSIILSNQLLYLVIVFLDKFDSMYYREILPNPILSQHIECFWELEILPLEAKRKHEVMAPDCTFDIIFSTSPILLEFTNLGYYAKMNAGGAFVGQKTTGIKFSIKTPQTVVGIRFKPFAFAKFFPISPQSLTNRTIPIEQFFPLKQEDRAIINKILSPIHFDEKVKCFEALILRFLKEKLEVDQLFRAQLNYILERKGLLEIKELFSTFGISKVTLRKHFLEKMGISPKVVSRIWRLNHFLELQGQTQDSSLTQLALESGYYDQAHFIREFKNFFEASPRHFFRQESQLLNISQQIIAKRFSNQYDPVFIA